MTSHSHLLASASQSLESSTGWVPRSVDQVSNDVLGITPDSSDERRTQAV